jgi:hypothetical protein
MPVTLNEKLIAYLVLFSGLAISLVAEFYSIIGFTAIFAAAQIPVIIMGIALGVGKIAATLWLKQNWKIAHWLVRTYLLTAIAVLMGVTSMGIFGFLSQAHSDQSLVSGDVQSKIAIYDEKIKTARENIDANRKALKQMDEAVDQVMARSSSETGADRAVAIRRSQLRERARLQSEIQAEQKTIAAIGQERAPIAAEVRKVEAEVGPIKYIAAMIYGDNPDANLLEKSVTWVIVIIVAVFDPLAVLMLLASQMAWQWYKKDKEDVEQLPNPYVADVGEKPTAEELEPEIEPVVQPLVEESVVETVPVHTPVIDIINETQVPQAIDPTEVVVPTTGTEFPNNPSMGQEFTRLDFDPVRVFVFNGEQWVDAIHSENTYIIKKDNQQVAESYVQNSEQKESGIWKTIKARSNE